MNGTKQGRYLAQMMGIFKQVCLKMPIKQFYLQTARCIDLYSNSSESKEAYADCFVLGKVVQFSHQSGLVCAGYGAGTLKPPYLSDRWSFPCEVVPPMGVRCGGLGCVPGPSAFLFRQARSEVDNSDCTLRPSEDETNGLIPLIFYKKIGNMLQFLRCRITKKSESRCFAAARQASMTYRSKAEEPYSRIFRRNTTDSIFS